jgi:thiol-disulfide isomerase/thioredoxin
VQTIDGVVTPFPSGGGQDISASLSLQGRLAKGFSGALGLRYPVFQQMTGDVDDNAVQMVSDPSLFAGISYRLGGSKVVKKASPGLPKPSVAKGEIPKDPEIFKLLGDGQVTIIDYWATWCPNCMRLMPYIDAWKSNNPGVTVAKVDATKWEVAQFQRFLPALPELPALDVYGTDKRLIIRLGGPDVFKFRDYLPKGVDKGYPEGWEPPKAKTPGSEKAGVDEPETPAEKPADPPAAEGAS